MDRCIHGPPRRVGAGVRKIHGDLDLRISLHEAANSRAEPRNAERNVAADAERTRAAAQPEPAHAANKIAFAFKEQRRTWFRDLLARLDVDDADTLALQLQLLVDGAIAAALVRGDPKVAGTARKAACVLLAAAGVKLPADSRPGRSRRAKHAR